MHPASPQEPAALRLGRSAGWTAAAARVGFGSRLCLMLQLHMWSRLQQAGLCLTSDHVASGRHSFHTSGGKGAVSRQACCSWHPPKARWEQVAAEK